MKQEDLGDFDVESAFRNLTAKPRRGEHGAKGRRRRESSKPRRPVGELKQDQFAIRVTRSMRANVRSWAYQADENETYFTEQAWAERAMRMGIIPVDPAVLKEWLEAARAAGVTLPEAVR